VFYGNNITILSSVAEDLELGEMFKLYYYSLA